MAHDPKYHPEIIFFENCILLQKLDSLRKKLKELNFENVKKENQINNIFDFKDGRLLKDKRYARIRTVHDLINNKTLYNEFNNLHKL